MSGKGFVPLVVMLAGASLSAQQAPKPSDDYDELYRRYVQSARTAPADASIAWLTGLATDRRARQVNDLVTIRVVESISASGTADSTLSKNSDGSASLGSFFGLEKWLPSRIDPTSLANTKSDSSFKGAGVTTRTSDLSASLTARVAEVLPNGDLVLEGVREIEVNGDRQIVVLTGVVRARDITAQNQVLSTSIGQLRIRYFGRGLMKDNLKPGWLIRILNKLF